MSVNNHSLNYARPDYRDDQYDYIPPTNERPNAIDRAEEDRKYAKTCAEVLKNLNLTGAKNMNEKNFTDHDTFENVGTRALRDGHLTVSTTALMAFILDKFDSRSPGGESVSKITLIKDVRAITGWGLRESKDFVEGMVHWCSCGKRCSHSR